MRRALRFAGGGLLAAAGLALLGRARERAYHDRLTRRLAARAGQAPVAVDRSRLAELPPPVAAYFERCLQDGQGMIRTARLWQSGRLRTRTEVERWTTFTARQLVVPPAPGFVWEARVHLPLGTHVRVVDSYVDGVGAGRVSLLSLLALGGEAGLPELNAGALHRYLAEAVWFPTALLPQAGVEWTALDDRRALARRRDHGTEVSLEFRFADGEVEAIYAPARFGRFAGGYRPVPWEGHFAGYREEAGMRVPTYGEVGWYLDGRLQLVWQGELQAARYELATCAAPGVARAAAT